MAGMCVCANTGITRPTCPFEFLADLVKCSCLCDANGPCQRRAVALECCNDCLAEHLLDILAFAPDSTPLVRTMHWYICLVDRGAAGAVLVMQKPQPHMTMRGAILRHCEPGLKLNTIRIN